MLTKRQDQTLRFVHAEIQKTGVSPSLSKIAAHLNLKSRSGALVFLNRLEERGFIKRMNNRARDIEVIKPPIPRTVYLKVNTGGGLVEIKK